MQLDMSTRCGAVGLGRQINLLAQPRQHPPNQGATFIKAQICTTYAILSKKRAPHFCEAFAAYLCLTESCLRLSRATAKF